MFCVVYLLRRWGEKLPADESRRDPRAGWLYLGQAEMAYPQTDAILFTDEKRAKELVRMRHAQVKRIDRGGILIAGNDSPKDNHWQPQVWWCVPGALDDLTTGAAPSD